MLVRAPLLLLLAVALACANAYLLIGQIYWLRGGLPLNDWSGFIRIDMTDLRSVRGVVNWSLPAAWVMSALIVPLGYGIWAALHVAALALFRDWRLAALIAVSFPFWADMLNGNVLVFVLLAALWAVKGSRLGIVAFCILAAAIPRPIMIPVLAWLLLRYPLARWSFAAAAIGVVGVSVWAGDLDLWLSRLTGVGGLEMAQDHNFAPSLFLGPAWLFIAWPLAALAWWRGWLGVASILVSPYWLGYYFVMLFLDVARLGKNQSVAQDGRELDRTRRGNLRQLEIEQV